ncbi:TRAP transporter permease [Pseudooceanicola algae]|uniref:TRAP C4-dicarboxylate transport system permease DctM subunit domain-containing protein n=1 Tax=Pseudooceanicola algae TaxID=1537215 RepID=A0A418SLD8_9RHOB|nr:TRAP transporter fused permease subunit [Pseudooceanicola algae]QPM90572.1 hypothetical protein PSAL_018110 [Pseudooceanicola algae]
MTNKELAQIEVPDEEFIPDIEPTTLPGRIAKTLTPVVGLAITLVALIYTLDVFIYINVFLFSEQFYAVLYGLIFAGGFLMLPMTKSRAKTGQTWLDLALALVGLAVGTYLGVTFPQIVRTAGLLLTERTIVCSIALALIFELTRRAFGWSLVLLTAAFMAYALFKNHIPGPMGGRATSWARLSNYMITDTSALLGMVPGVVFGMVFAFLLFGRALFLTGGGNFFTEISMSLMGHRRGGPAKVAVFASGLFGSLSGSASGNVVVTGTITIPMMIRNGFRPATAGAVEAVASTGGSLLPPIMGATAFVMAEFLQLPYHEIVRAALVPALLYYIALFLQVDLEAGRLGLRGLKRSELPKLLGTLLRGWSYLVPLAALLYCLFVLYLTPTKSALITTAVVILVSYIGPQPMTWRKFKDTLITSGTAMVELGLVAAIAGLILGIINLTGIGLLISQQVLALAGGNLMIMLVLTALCSIVLGMSMPVTASYVILAVLAAPALTQAGIPELSAHLFVFYFAALSFLTPPVCVAVFVAATIANSDPMDTAWQAMKLAIVAYIVPFVFVLDPGLLLMGPLGGIALNIASALLGLGAVSISLVGFARGAVGLPMRFAFLAVGIGAFLPSVTISLVCMALILVGLAFVLRTGAQEEPTAA